MFFNISKADRRCFARSYTSYTIPAKALELEIWNTGKIEKDSGYFYRWQPRVEFEQGVTDKLTSAIYFNFDETRTSNNSYKSKSFSFSSVLLEMRYRLFEIGEYLIDPALYGEIYYGGDKIKYELKIFLSKRINEFIGVVNLISEIEKSIPNSSTELKFEITGGVAYEFNSSAAIGVEFRLHQNYKEIYEAKKNQDFFVGPTVNFQTEKFYLTINFLTQLTGTPSGNRNLDLIGMKNIKSEQYLELPYENFSDYYSAYDFIDWLWKGFCEERIHEVFGR